MRFELCVDIDAEPPVVWRLFADPANLPRWQPTLQSYEKISGEPGWPGATSLLVYHEGGRKREMKATVLAREEERHFSGRYETAWASNDMACTFQPLGEDRTRWRAFAEFRFKGWTKMIAPLLRGGIRKRLEDDMLRFKELVESGEIDANVHPAVMRQASRPMQGPADRP